MTNDNNLFLSIMEKNTQIYHFSEEIHLKFSNNTPTPVPVILTSPYKKKKPIFQTKMYIF